MKHLLLAPDSFKGSLSAVRVCEIVKAAFLSVDSSLFVDAVPVADGGEGTVDAFVSALSAERKELEVTAPLFNKTSAAFALLPDSSAVIEMAQASGLPLAGDKKNPLETTTFGTGELILAALDSGCKKIALGIGGSATNDGGIGCAAALGAKFLDKNGAPVPLCGKGLSLIHSIDLTGLDRRLDNCEIRILCDVTNPLFGENGAAYVFAPQKGADKASVRLLDEGLQNLSSVVKCCLGKDYSAMHGAGAAGGLGFGAMAFFGAKPVGGAQEILSLAGFFEKAEKASLIITGEGKADRQSLMGKVPAIVAKNACGKRLAAIVGVNELSDEETKALGFERIFETNPLHLPFEKILPNCEKDLFDTAKEAATVLL